MTPKTVPPLNTIDNIPPRPRKFSPCVVVRRVGHLALALARRAVAAPVRVRAVVEALQVLAVIPVVSRVTHTPRNWKLHRAPTVEGAVVCAVLQRGFQNISEYNKNITNIPVCI